MLGDHLAQQPLAAFALAGLQQGAAEPGAEDGCLGTGAEVLGVSDGRLVVRGGQGVAAPAFMGLGAGGECPAVPQASPRRR